MTPPLDSLPGVQILSVGAQAEPVVIIDDFCADPERLIEDASGRHFQPLGKHYPGIRAPAPAAYLTEQAGLLQRVLTEVFDMAGGARLVECNYSIVTTPANALTPFQSLPHFDTTDRGRIALLHYLCPSHMGGTKFYRHRSTSYETITSDRLAAYETALRTDTAQTGLPGGFIQGSTPMFEETCHIHARPNRMAIYRGQTLHSGVIPDTYRPSLDPRLGRLTLNTFLQAR